MKDNYIKKLTLKICLDFLNLFLVLQLYLYQISMISSNVFELKYIRLIFTKYDCLSLTIFDIIYFPLSFYFCNDTSFIILLIIFLKLKTKNVIQLYFQEELLLLQVLLI